MKIPFTKRNAWEALIQRMDVRQLQQHEDKVLFILTLMIGAAVGLVVVAFIVVTENLGSQMYPAGGAAWRRVFIPIVGSLIAGFLLVRYFPDARGSGIPQTKTALFLNSGIIRLRTVVGKFLCSSLSLASGIALGREGPSVQVGAGIASLMGRQFGLSREKTKSLVPIGAAAALAAAFNTPIAAVLFTLEEVMGDLHARVLGAIVMSSATSWMVLHLLLGDEPLFHVPAYQLVHPVEFILYAALGALGGLVSVAFVKLLLKLRSYFLKMPSWTAWFQPAMGGLLVGILGWFVPSVLGVGYGNVGEALNSKMAIGMMALLVVLKLISTAGCYASGNAGGIFGPSLFIGAMMGGAFGAGAHALMPDYTGSVGAYALVGMGAAFAGIIRVPMTSVIMIFEITRDYSIIVPLMIANLLSYFISSRMQKKPIYEALMQQDGIHLPVILRGQDVATSVSQGMRIPDKTLQSTDRVEAVLSVLDQEVPSWPVMDSKGLRGMITRDQIQKAVREGRQQMRIGDLLSDLDRETMPTAENLPHLHPDQPLDMALRRMAQSGQNLLPVVSRTNPRDLVGALGLEDAMTAYKAEGDGQTGDRDLSIAKAPTAAMGRIAVVLVLMIGLAGFLSYFYRSQRANRAEQYALTGNELIKDGRYQEAVEKFRSALSISHSIRDRLALANALLKAGRWNESEIYFKELAREDPDSGPVNIGLARIAAQKKQIQDAIGYYHKSIYGYWPDKSQANGMNIRIELLEFLARSGQSTQARAELLTLMTERPEEVGARKRVARLLLEYGLSTEAAQMFQEILRQDPDQGEAYAGLGQAEFAQGNFMAARQAWKSALRRNPNDEKSTVQLELTEQILELDPNRRGLRIAERYSKSRLLADTALQSLSRCLAAENKPIPDTAAPIIDATRKSLARATRSGSYGDAMETNLRLATQLWKERMHSCGQIGPQDKALEALMTRIPE